LPEAIAAAAGLAGIGQYEGIQIAGQAPDQLQAAGLVPGLAMGLAPGLATCLA
jgi:hypothetical protein